MTYSSLVFGVLQTNSCSSFSMYDIDLSECINGPLLMCHMTHFFYLERKEAVITNGVEPRASVGLACSDRVRMLPRCRPFQLR